MSDAESILAILSCVSDLDAHDCIYWGCDDNPPSVTFYVNCNDLFYWATADAEILTVEDLPALRQAVADVLAIDGVGIAEGFELWVARKRGMRPQQPAYPHDARIRALFNACGPVRDPRSEG